MKITVEDFSFCSSELFEEGLWLKLDNNLKHYRRLGQSQLCSALHVPKLLWLSRQSEGILCPYTEQTGAVI